MRRLSATLALVSLPYLACAQPAKPPGKTPTDIGDRVYIGDTSTYDATPFLGQIGIVDDGRVSMFVDKPHFLCTYDKAQSTAKVTPMTGATALTITVENGYSGSLSFFVVNANVSTEQRATLAVDDVSTASLSNACSLSESDIRRIASRIPMARGKRVIYVSGTTLSHLSTQVYDHQEGGGGISAGSWLKIGAEAYKSNGRTDSVPITAVKGIFVDVPAGPVPPQALSALRLTKFDKLTDLVGSQTALQVSNPITIPLPK